MMLCEVFNLFLNIKLKKMFEIENSFTLCETTKTEFAMANFFQLPDGLFVNRTTDAQAKN